MRLKSLLAVLFAVGLAGRAWAEPPPPPPPPPYPDAAPGEGVPQPQPMPPADTRRVVDATAPPNTSVPVRTSYGAGAPCDDLCPCFQSRDRCGWPLDRCGKRRGAWDVTLEGTYNFYSSPDGDLGEPIFGGPSPQINWDGVDYKGQFGGRGTISYRVEPFTRVEARGTYYGKADESGSQAGFFAATPGITGSGDVSRPVDAALSSQVEAYGAELNWWTEMACEGHWRVDAGAGARYLHLDETAHTDFVTTGPGPFPVANGFVDSNVTSEFFGVQGLVAVHGDVTQRVEAYGSFKGMLGNLHTDVSVSDNSIFVGGSHSSSRKDDQIVLGFDLELGVKVGITDRIGVTAGYDLLFLDNVQRAEDAMDFTHSNTGAVQAGSSVDQLLIHTLFVGVSINF